MIFELRWAFFQHYGRKEKNSLPWIKSQKVVKIAIAEL